jgi:outer membrane protein assembly factor BamA
VAYPFDRANRLELNGGARHIGFDREADVRAVSLVTGEELVDETRNLPSLDSLVLGTGSAAFVHDTSLYGPTSPILGSRFRLEGGAKYGTLTYSDALIDYRQYFMPARPFTIAGRVLHTGRYGGDSEDRRLAPNFVGYPHLVRGYDVYSFSAAECRASTAPGEIGCPVFDQLLGSRMVVANLELRFPIVGAFSGELNYGPIPVELALFADAGVAWDSSVNPFFLGGERDPVSSAGIAVRVAVQRFLAMEFDFVRPFDRPEKGWMFLFNFRPGF